MDDREYLIEDELKLQMEMVRILVGRFANMTCCDDPCPPNSYRPLKCQDEILEELNEKLEDYKISREECLDCYTTYARSRALTNFKKRGIKLTKKY